MPSLLLLLNSPSPKPSYLEVEFMECGDRSSTHAYSQPPTTVTVAAIDQAVTVYMYTWTRTLTTSIIIRPIRYQLLNNRINGNYFKNSTKFPYVQNWDGVTYSPKYSLIRRRNQTLIHRRNYSLYINAWCLFSRNTVHACIPSKQRAPVQLFANRLSDSHLYRSIYFKKTSFNLYFNLLIFLFLGTLATSECFHFEHFVCRLTGRQASTQ